MIPGIIIGAVALAVLEAIAAIVLYVVFLKRSIRPNRPAQYHFDIHPHDDTLADGPRPTSAALAEWAEAKLAEVGIEGAQVSRVFPALRVAPHHVAFWLAADKSSVRVGLTFVTRADRALVDEHAPYVEVSDADR